MAGKRWTDTEVNLLNQLYPKMTNGQLANEVFDDRSADSISRKARRLNIEKEENFRFKQKIRNNSPPKKDDEFEMFLLGLLCAEGSFINSINGDREKFVLKIEMNMKNNQPMFQEIKDYVGVGRLSTYTRRNVEIQRYTVGSIPKNISVICCMMERNELPVNTWRTRQYREWRNNMLTYVEDNYGQECHKLSKKVINDA